MPTTSRMKGQILCLVCYHWSFLCSSISSYIFLCLPVASSSASLQQGAVSGLMLIEQIGTMHLLVYKETLGTLLKAGDSPCS